MSSILKALRKLETDKSALGEGSVDLGRDILKRSYRPAKEWNPLLIAAVGFLLATAVGGGLWWFDAFNAGKRETTSLTAPSTIQDSATQLSSQPQEAQRRVTKNTPVAQTASQFTVRSSAPSAEVALKPPPIVVKNPKPAAVVANSVPQTSLSTEPERFEKTSSPLVLPDLQVAEIVFQEQADARLAVINDLPVMEGTVIDGAEVIEILPDRVRFNLQGVQFEKLVTSGALGPNH